MMATTRCLYACGVDWQHEVGETSSRFYKTVEELKRAEPCWKWCGIVQVWMSALWIVEQKDFGASKPKKAAKPKKKKKKS